MISPNKDWKWLISKNMNGQKNRCSFRFPPVFWDTPIHPYHWWRVFQWTLLFIHLDISLLQGDFVETETSLERNFQLLRLQRFSTVQKTLSLFLLSWYVCVDMDKNDMNIHTNKTTNTTTAIYLCLGNVRNDLEISFEHTSSFKKRSQPPTKWLAPTNTIARASLSGMCTWRLDFTGWLPETKQLAPAFPKRKGLPFPSINVHNFQGRSG